MTIGIDFFFTSITFFLGALIENCYASQFIVCAENEILDFRLKPYIFMILIAAPSTIWADAISTQDTLYSKTLGIIPVSMCRKSPMNFQKLAKKKRLF